MNVTKVISVLILGLKKICTGRPIVENLLYSIIFVPQVVNTIVAFRMLVEIIFLSKCVGSLNSL